MAEKPIIMEDSPEAASIKTVTGWVSRTGRFCGDDERMARFDGSTHNRRDPSRHRVRTREAQVMVAPGDCNAQATT